MDVLQLSLRTKLVPAAHVQLENMITTHAGDGDHIKVLAYRLSRSEDMPTEN